MMRENSRRSRALAELSHAEDSVSKAIYLLGGYTRVAVPKKNPSTFVARKMLEGVHLRLHAIVNLLNYGERPAVPQDPETIFPQPRLRDDQDEPQITPLESGLNLSTLGDSLDSNSRRPRSDAQGRNSSTPQFHNDSEE